MKAAITNSVLIVFQEEKNSGLVDEELEEMDDYFVDFGGQSLLPNRSCTLLTMDFGRESLLLD